MDKEIHSKQWGSERRTQRRDSILAISQAQSSGLQSCILPRFRQAHSCAWRGAMISRLLVGFSLPHIRFNATNPPGNETACVSSIRGLQVDAEVPSVCRHETLLVCSEAEWQREQREGETRLYNTGRERSATQGVSLWNRVGSGNFFKTS
jgi:hypothetical protein